MGNPALEEAEEIKKLKENLAANGDSFDEWLLMTAKYTNQVYEGNEVVEETSIETPSFWDKFKYAWVTTWKWIWRMIQRYRQYRKQKKEKRNHNEQPSAPKEEAVHQEKMAQALTAVIQNVQKEMQYQLEEDRAASRKLIRQQERAIKKSERKQQMLLKDVKRRQTTTQSLSVIRSVFPWAVVIGTVVCIYLIYQSQPEWIVHVWKKIDG